MIVEINQMSYYVFTTSLQLNIIIRGEVTNEKYKNRGTNLFWGGLFSPSECLLQILSLVMDILPKNQTLGQISIEASNSSS